MNKVMAACAVTLALVAVAGCGGKPTAKQALDKSSAAYKNVKTMTIDAQDGFQLTTGGQWQGRGGKVAIKFSKPNKVVQETPGQPTLISDGKTAYLYNVNEKMYMEIPAEMVIKNLTSDQSAASLLGLLVGKEPYKGVKNAKMLSEERIGDVDTYVVQYVPAGKLTMPGLEKATLKEKVWIGKEDWLVRKRQVVAEVPKEVMQQQLPEGSPAEKATLEFTSEAQKMVVNGTIADSAFKAPKGAEKMEVPGQGEPPPEGSAPPPAPKK